MMRSNLAKLEAYPLKSLFRLGREVTQTSVWLGVVLVLGLCAVTLPFRSALMKTPDAPSAFNPSVALQAPVAKPVKDPAGVGRSFKGPVGVQLYSLRGEFKNAGVPATLARIRAMGIREIETAGYYGMTAAAFRSELDKAGLKAVSMHADFDDLRVKVNEIVSAARVLGVSYVVCPWIPHEHPFTLEQAKQAVLVFNQAGAVLKAAGLKFCYHPHGYEFQPQGDGTLFDWMAQQTKPELVSFELDVFWATHGGQDAAKLLLKYPRRFVMLHLKDLRKDVPGDLTGDTTDDTSVILGTGKVDWPAVLRAAKQIGIKHYFIEAEEPEAPTNIPLSLRYLELLRF
ncbi:MAG: sugar phosphate isomerase/epimerase [Acidobacteria bacterium]|nr:sugar phosphate isomerase/epimerase [Acidobacteriota bacterium]MBI3424628.1 sugar phosphate isomerase/epimerase [Acidobacteriota bacterium]